MSISKEQAWRDLAEATAVRVAVRVSQGRQIQLARPRLDKQFFFISLANEEGQRDLYPLLFMEDRAFYERYPDGIEVDYVFDEESEFSQKDLEGVASPFREFLLEIPKVVDDERLRLYRPIPFYFPVVDKATGASVTMEMWMYVDSEHYELMEQAANAALNDWHHELGQADPNAVLPEETVDDWDQPDESDFDWSEWI